MSAATHCIPFDPDCTLCNPVPSFDTRGEQPHCEKTGKIMYRSPEAAEHARVELKKRKNERGLHTYRCPHCRAWHVGHGHADRPSQPARRKSA